MNGGTVALSTSDIAESTAIHLVPTIVGFFNCARIREFFLETTDGKILKNGVEYSKLTIKELQEGDLFVWDSNALEMCISTLPHRPLRMGRRGKTVDYLYIVGTHRVCASLSFDSKEQLQSVGSLLIYPHDNIPILRIQPEGLSHQLFQESYDRLKRNLLTTLR
jgi:hypothetical protein